MPVPSHTFEGSNDRFRANSTLEEASWRKLANVDVTTSTKVLHSIRELNNYNITASFIKRIHLRILNFDLNTYKQGYRLFKF